MAEDTHGLGIPLPADSTPIHRYPSVARAMGEKIAEILAGGITDELLNVTGPAAERAVDIALDRADIITGDDDRVPRRVDSMPYAEAWADPAGRAALKIMHDGTVSTPGGLDTPSLNGMRFIELPEESGYVGAWADSQMRAPLAIRADGTVDLFPSKTTLDRIPVPKMGRTDPRLDGGADVYLLIGQSNMHGGGVGFDRSLDVQFDGLNQFAGSGTNKNKIIPAVDSLFHHNQWISAGAPLVGPGMEFGRQSLLAAPSNRTVLLVPAAMGATSISGSADFSWDPDNTSAAVNLFKYAQAQLRAAAATHPANRVAGILWHQGEGDTGKMSTEQYLAKLQQICDLLRAEFGQSVPFLVGSMVPDWIGTNSTRTSIDAAHRAIASTRPFAAYVRGPAGMHQDEKLHYNAAGQREMGRRFFHALTAAKANTLGL